MVMDMALSDRFEILNATALDRLPFLSRLILDLAILVAKWQLRSNTRHCLMKLDNHLLNDIGLLPSEAYIEGKKRFWQN